MRWFSEAKSQILNLNWQQLKTKRFWKRLLFSLQLWVSDIKEAVQNNFIFNSAWVYFLAFLVLSAVSSRLYFTSKEAHSVKENAISVETQAKSITKIKTSQEIEDEFQKAQLSLTKAWKAAPEDLSVNAALANLYLLKSDFDSANIYYSFLQNSYPDATETNLLTGLWQLQHGEYETAKDTFIKLKKTGLEDEALQENLALSLIASNRTIDAAQLAGWPDDCQVNSVAHAACMKKMADWHAQVASIEEHLNRCLLDQNKALFHRRRQLIFLGESLRTLLRGIEETDGLVRQKLIAKYEEQKRELTALHAEFMRQSYFDKEKITEKELSREEKRLRVL